MIEDIFVLFHHTDKIKPIATITIVIIRRLQHFFATF